MRPYIATIENVQWVVCPYCYGGDQHKSSCRAKEWHPRLTPQEMFALECRKRLMPPEEATLIKEAWE